MRHQNGTAFSTFARYDLKAMQNTKTRMMSRLVAKFALMSSVSAALSACASFQINNNTLDIAGSYDQLIVKQVVYNIKKTGNSKFSIPAVVKVTAGSATTSNSFTPSASVPISSSLTKGVNFAAAITSSRSNALAGQGLSLGASNQWSQTYTLSPVIDSDQLRRLRLLYQYANRQISDEDFESNFPVVEATLPPSKDSPIYVRRSVLTDITGTRFLGYTWVRIIPDVTFIRQPGCALCDYKSTLTREDLSLIKDPEITKNASRVRKLEKNVDLRNDWLVQPGDAIDEDAIAIPPGDVDQIFVRNTVRGIPGEGVRYFYEFVLLTEDASSGGTGSPSSGGQSDGRKTAPLQRISVPVAAGGGFLP